MILVDTSVWIDHFRRDDPLLRTLLSRGEVALHPFVRGELALGSLPQRAATLTELRRLPTARVATADETELLIENVRLVGSGIGYVDVHLLAAARLGSDRLWTSDRRLARAATKLDVAFDPTNPRYD